MDGSSPIFHAPAVKIHENIDKRRGLKSARIVEWLILPRRYKGQQMERASLRSLDPRPQGNLHKATGMVCDRPKGVGWSSEANRVMPTRHWAPVRLQIPKPWDLSLLIPVSACNFRQLYFIKLINKIVHPDIYHSNWLFKNMIQWSKSVNLM